MVILKALTSWMKSSEPTAEQRNRQELLRQQRLREAEQRHQMLQQMEKQSPYELSVGQEYWIYKPDTSNSMQLVPAAGSDEGELLSVPQLTQLRQNSTCLEARVNVAASQYWRQPSSAQAVRLMNQLGLDTCAPESFLFSNTLVTDKDPKGIWMRVIIEDKSMVRAVLDDTMEDEVGTPQAIAVLS